MTARQKYRAVLEILAGVALLSLGVALLAPHVRAQTPAPIAPPMAPRPVQDLAQQLIDQQREQARQRQLARPPAQISVAPQAGEASPNIPLDTPVDQIPEPGPTFHLQQIVLAGPGGQPLIRTAVSQSTLEAITAAFTGHEIGSHRLNVLLRRLTNAYVSAGYVTTRAVLGPQNIGTGMLTVVIQTGLIEAFNVTLDAGISQGLPRFDANHDGPDIRPDAAHAQFTKVDATATWTLPLPKLGSAAFAYRGTLGGQYTNVPLYGTDQLYLGGMDTILGFRLGDIAGDRGFYSRNELAWVNVRVWHDGRIEPYAFLDAGRRS